MTNKLARLIVRLQGAAFLFYAVIDLTYLPTYYRSYVAVHEVRRLDEYATQGFAMAVLRVGLNALAALVLLARSDKIIEFFAEDSAIEEPNKTAQTTTGSSAPDRV